MKPLCTILIAGLAVSSCGGSGETAATDPVTTIATTTTVAPTTTTTEPLVSRTSDSGLLYRVESASWFGGFELHLRSGSVRYGFADAPAGTETVPEMLLRFVLWSFANQHSQFVSPDGQVDLAGYVTFLESNGWIDDEAYVPVTVGVGMDMQLFPYGQAGVEKSAPLRLDYKQPFIIGNDDLTKLDGFEVDDPNVLFISSDGCCRTFFGVTATGQLYFTMHVLEKGVVKQLPIPPTNSVVISYRLGEVLEVTSRITYPESSPQEQWFNPSTYYNDPFRVNHQYPIPPYPILNILELVGYDAATNTTINKLFAPTTRP